MHGRTDRIDIYIYIDILYICTIAIGRFSPRAILYTVFETDEVPAVNLADNNDALDWKYAWTATRNVIAASTFPFRALLLAKTNENDDEIAMIFAASHFYDFSRERLRKWNAGGKKRKKENTECV